LNCRYQYTFHLLIVKCIVDLSLDEEATSISNSVGSDTSMLYRPKDTLSHDNIIYTSISIHSNNIGARSGLYDILLASVSCHLETK